jgi:hypothetical protein
MKNIWILVCLSFLISCKSGKKTPENIFPPEKMEAVLWDIFRADELAAQLKTNDSTKTAIQWHTGLYDQVFKLHNVSKLDFKKSFDFYQSRPDLLKPMLESLAKKSDKLAKQD